MADQANGQSLYNIIDVKVAKSAGQVASAELVNWQKEIATITSQENSALSPHLDIKSVKLSAVDGLFLKATIAVLACRNNSDLGITPCSLPDSLISTRP